MNEKQEEVIDWAYYGKIVLRLVVIGALLGGIALFINSRRNELWFAATTPQAVATCMEGYQGEHFEADRRFRLKQSGTIISPIAEGDEETKKD